MGICDIIEMSEVERVTFDQLRVTDKISAISVLRNLYYSALVEAKLSKQLGYLKPQELSALEYVLDEYDQKQAKKKKKSKKKAWGKHGRDSG